MHSQANGTASVLKTDNIEVARDSEVPFTCVVSSLYSSFWFILLAVVGSIDGSPVREPILKRRLRAQRKLEHLPSVGVAVASLACHSLAPVSCVPGIAPRIVVVCRTCIDIRCNFDVWYVPSRRLTFDLNEQEPLA
jgi:hypothetical protein